MPGRQGRLLRLRRCPLRQQPLQTRGPARGHRALLGRRPLDLRAQLAAFGAAPHEALFIGDGGGDLRACRETGVPFVDLDEHSEWEDASVALDGQPVVIAATWIELRERLGLGS
jgi:phosphoglycolate phosphatase-like HAD superfamily hydrolase